MTRIVVSVLDEAVGAGLTASSSTPPKSAPTSSEDITPHTGDAGGVLIYCGDKLVRGVRFGRTHVICRCGRLVKAVW